MLSYCSSLTTLAKACFTATFLITTLFTYNFTMIQRRQHFEVLETKNLTATKRPTSGNAINHESLLQNKKIKFKEDSDLRKLQLPIVLYNRVPKCGSSAMIWTVQQERKKKHFPLLDINLPQLKEYGDNTAQAETVLYMNALPNNTFVIRHLHFLDFDKFASKWPRYINVIRNPVERFISFYYYVRNGFEYNKGKINNKWRRNLTEEERNTSLDYCMKKGPHDCVTKSTPTFLAYFCGQEEKCRDYSSNYSLTKAKMNVEKHFLAVGLTEDMENTLRMFNALLPSHFSGIAKSSWKTVSAQTKTYNRPEIKKETRELLKKELKYEIEFYEFIKKRFYMQLSDLKHQNRIS